MSSFQAHFHKTRDGEQIAFKINFHIGKLGKTIPWWFLTTDLFAATITGRSSLSTFPPKA